MTLLEFSPSRPHWCFAAVAALLATVGCGDDGQFEEMPIAQASSPTETDSEQPTTPAGSSPAVTPTQPAASEPSPDTDATATDASGTETTDEPVLPRCLPPEGVSGSPGTLVEVMNFANSLPRPLTVACFLQALDRPLAVTTTSSFVSAQPAADDANPRIFLRIKDLYISVVPAGTGRELMEFGELTSNQRSYKAEVVFPLTGPLEPEMFYESIMRTSSSVCAFCHADEVMAEHETLGYTLESVAYRPNPVYDVPLEDVRREHELCDPELEPERCAIYSGLFDHGPVEYHAFPEDMDIFF